MSAAAVALAPHVYVSWVTYLTNLAILVVLGGVLYLAIRWLRGKARAARLAAWERDGLLEPEDARALDPDLSPEARARALDDPRD